jgi:pyruvate, water dikinase
MIPDKRVLMTVKGDSRTVGSGIKTLDNLLQGLRLGDNVVWQVDNLKDYAYFAESFVARSIDDGYKCIYVRFAAHPQVLKPRSGLTIIDVDPSPGFDFFSTAVHRIIEENGKKVCYVFDNLSDLVNKWATDELLGNFFHFTCPYLFELETVTYFALTRNQHAVGTIARIRDTTQILLDLYHVEKQSYIHPLKVWDRYSSEMFLPHLVSGINWLPVFRSGDAAALSISASKRPSGAMAVSIAPWDSVYSKLMQYQGIGSELPEARRETAALQQELTRMLIGNHPAFIKLADRYLSIDDLMQIRNRMIGSGRIGGKAAGMLVARKILLQKNGGRDFSHVLEEHDSFFIGSDVFFTFLVNNDLFHLKLQLSRNSQISREEFGQVEQQFLAGEFPGDIIGQFKDLLDYFGQAPIIVRSSSLLEDSFGNAFAGKYRSEFCANQGNPDERLEAFMREVKLVYASALNPDALLYRKKRGLGEGDEQMAILVQRVSGMPYRKYFFPPLAGVAFSRNLYAWTDRIDPQKGMLRLVFGLGTRAVNRVGGDYPRMIAVSHPALRPEIGRQISKYSQKNIDLLDLEKNEFVTQSVGQVIENLDYPNLHLLASTMSEGFANDPLYASVDGPPENVVLTFNNMVNKTDIIKVMDDILTKLEKAWEQPVDIEFTANVDKNGEVRVNLLQCRPLRVPRAPDSPTALPQNLDAQHVLFKSNRIISGGVVDDIKYVIYIDPDKYAGMPSLSMKRSLGRVVGKLNEYLGNTKEKVIAIGPGRWGSSNIDLGVNVSYADINNFTVLVEVGRANAENEPELSYGTHFFQDLVEADIIYLPVFPDKRATGFNHRFFAQSTNILARILPDYVEYEDVIKVIDVPAAEKGAFAHIVADAQTRKAVCYLK